MTAKRTTRKAGVDMVLFLQRQLESERRLNLALMKQLEEKDAQIRMVLERHYEQPVVTRTGPAPAPQVSVEPSVMTEVPQFDPAKDEEAREADEQRYENSRTAFDAELAAIEAAQREAVERREHPRTPGAFKQAEDAGHEAARAVEQAAEATA